MMNMREFKGYRQYYGAIRTLFNKGMSESEIPAVPRRNRLHTAVLVVFIILVVMAVFHGCAYSETIEGHSINTWAEAIHHAEGNDNYGILAHYKHTTYKQACINTIRHKHSNWVREGQHGAFLSYLGAKYCPIGCNNDNGTNRYWIDNVKYWLNRLES